MTEFDTEQIYKYILLVNLDADQCSQCGYFALGLCLCFSGSV